MKSISYCLVSSIFEPTFMLLDREKPYMVGRDSRAEVFLPARQVSRRHSKIAWSDEDQGFVIRDMFSRRGFLVNGNRMERRLLRDDDEITIEPYKLRFRVYDGDLGPLLRRSELPRDWRLAGRCRGAELLELLAYVDAAGLSAALKVEGDTHSGSLVVARGGLVSAEAGFLKAGRAAQALLMTEKASFELRAAEVPPQPGQTPMPMTQLLGEILGKMGSDFVTVMDSTGLQESDLMRVEKRMRAAETERQLRAIVRKGELLDSDVSRVRELQQAMQRPLPRQSRLEFAALIEPAAAVGGVVHDVRELGNGRYRLFLAHAGGGGLEGCLRATVIKTEYDLANDAGLRAGDVLAMLRRRLAQRLGEPNGFQAACVDVLLDPVEAPLVTFAADGLPALVHCHNGLAASRLPEPTMGGVTLDGMTAATSELRLAKGDRLLLFTSALVKQRDSQGREHGVQRVLTAAASSTRLPLTPALAEISAEAHSFRGSVPRDGDLGIVAVECHELH